MLCETGNVGCFSAACSVQVLERVLASCLQGEPCMLQLRQRPGQPAQRDCELVLLCFRAPGEKSRDICIIFHSKEQQRKSLFEAEVEFASYGTHVRNKNPPLLNPSALFEDMGYDKRAD